MIPSAHRPFHALDFFPISSTNGCPCRHTLHRGSNPGAAFLESMVKISIYSSRFAFTQHLPLESIQHRIPPDDAQGISYTLATPRTPSAVAWISFLVTPPPRIFVEAHGRYVDQSLSHACVHTTSCVALHPRHMNTNSLLKPWQRHPEITAALNKHHVSPFTTRHAIPPLVTWHRRSHPFHTPCKH